jgi:hypothetical protein
VEPQNLEHSLLYRRWAASLSGLGGDSDLLNTFARIRRIVSEQSKIIVRVFPEYTPHDATRHLEHLFFLSDRVLGAGVYGRLNAAELSLLVFALYAHDWGMAVSEEERAAILGSGSSQGIVLIPDEVKTFGRTRDEALRLGEQDERIWEDYLRDTHAQRSGHRLRKELAATSQLFAEMVARVAEGHALEMREIRDPGRYPVHVAVLGQVANVAAVATYVRLIDLLDLADDRTPFALWSMVRPRNRISRIEWSKHRALAPVAIVEQGDVRQAVISGTTDDPDVFAALADLRAWVDAQFAGSVGFLRYLGNEYDPRLDSAIKWDIKAIGFEPVLLRFDFDRSAALGLLSSEVYGGERLTFVRELMQNSVDAIDTRVELLRPSGAVLEGVISVDIVTLPGSIRVEWSDNGVGMDRYVLESYFAKVGRSWYQSPDFRRHSFAHDPISKFGIGLLSCFAASTNLTVITKREPSLAKDHHGWRVQIPTRDGYFSVRVDDQAPIGTKIILEVDKSPADTTAATLADAVRKAGPLVRYSLIVKVDGLVETFEPVTRSDDPRLPVLHVTSLDEAALASLRSLTAQFERRYQSPTGGFEAFFSCLLPRDISSITSLGTGDWRLGSRGIDFDDFIIEYPPELLLKGVRTGGERHSYSHRGVSSVSLNVLRPSLVHPDLSRGHFDISSVDLTDFWADVALVNAGGGWSAVVINSGPRRNPFGRQDCGPDPGRRS